VSDTTLSQSSSKNAFSTSSSAVGAAAPWRARIDRDTAAFPADR
jgi:hypothetical protein